MAKDRFAVNPFPDVRVSKLERQEVVRLVDVYVEDYVAKYEEFVKVGKREVDKRRWEHVKSKDNVRVYAERTRKELTRMGIEPENSLSATQRLKAGANVKDLPVLLSVGSFVGDMDDLIFGVMNPTLDDMRVKVSYVHDLASGAVLCPVLGPSKEDPFRSLVIKWMTIEVPLQSSMFVKSRDVVYIEATGTVFLSNGDHRVPPNQASPQQDTRERIRLRLLHAVGPEHYRQFCVCHDRRWRRDHAAIPAICSSWGHALGDELRVLRADEETGVDAATLSLCLRNSKRKEDEDAVRGLLEDDGQCHRKHWQEHLQNLLPFRLLLVQDPPVHQLCGDRRPTHPAQGRRLRQVYGGLNPVERAGSYQGPNRGLRSLQ